MRNQKETCSDGSDSDGSRNPYAGRHETFGGDGNRDDSHRAQVHDIENQQDRRQVCTAEAAIKSEADALPPCCARIGGWYLAVPRRFPATGIDKAVAVCAA